MSWTRKVMVVGGVVACLCISAQAAQTQLTLPELNYNITGFTHGYAYDPLFPGDQTWNGVTFTLVEEPAAGCNIWLASLSNSGSLDIPVNVFGTTKVYTLINSAYGTYGATNGKVEFYGSDGGYYEVFLVQGTNIRDHHNNGYNNTIDGSTAVEAFYDTAAGVRLDMQIYTLPSTFADETLETIRIYSPDSTSGTGIPFIAAATVETTSTTVPVPGAMALVVLGVGAVAGLRRRSAL